MRRIEMRQPSGRRAWEQLLRRAGADPEQVRRDAVTLRAFGKPVSARTAVTTILRQVRREGDRAVLRWMRRLQGRPAAAPGLCVTRAEQQAASRRVPESLRSALAQSANRIRRFHLLQRIKPNPGLTRPGVRLQERPFALERVGLYVPGGRAPLVATVLMNALPAAVAGVREIVLATPPQADGRVADALLYAAGLAGITEIYRLGGAVAVAAMAYGTRSLRPVDKIVGPGNIFVTEAKRQVLGAVGIDSLAGPSEILVIAEAGASPLALAWDLLAQGEHGSGAVAILLTPSPALVDQVEAAARELVREEPGLASALQAVAAVTVASLGQAAELAQAYGPEHLSLQVRQPQNLLRRLSHFGAAFLGSATPQAMGDYTAGPNHVLPTGGTCRWSSPLSVRDFMRYASVIQYTSAGVRREGPAAVAIARAEGLPAHGESIRVRMKPGRRRS